MSTSPTSRFSRPAVLVTSLAMAVAVAASACGSSADGVGLEGSGSTTAEATASTAEGAEDSTTVISTSVDAPAGSLFDASTIHSIEITVDEGDYAVLLETYIATGEKEWIEATVTIDGSTYEQVGIKLKGNSSLFGLSPDASPEDLPWLIRLDKYVDDQEHEGYVDLVVRSNNTTTAINEAVALELLGDAGLATEKAIEIGFAVNGSDAVLRLVVEHPDDVWMADNFSADGALYKAESDGDYSYRGDDPDAYDEIFDQEAGKDNADLTPLIEFLDFVNNADDETFTDELADRLDVDAFATYLAMMDLVDNFDDIDGPGNNSYLYYDTEAEQFTVVAWDLNLAFGVRNERGGGAAVAGAAVGSGDVGRGGVGGGDVGQRPEGGPPAAAAPGVQPGADDGDAVVPQRDEVAGGPGGSNVLAERFKANADFNSLYTDAVARLEAELIDSGHAATVLEEWTALLEGSPQLVDTGTVAGEASGVATYLT